MPAAVGVVAAAARWPALGFGVVCVLGVPAAVVLGAVLAARVAVPPPAGGPERLRPSAAAVVVARRDAVDVDDLVRAEAAMADARATFEQEWLLYARNPAACRAGRHPGPVRPR